MKDSDQEALDPEMTSLLRAEFAPASAEAKERVSNRLMQSAGALALSRATGAQVPRGVSTGATVLGALRAYPLGFVASFVLGTAFGSGLYAAVQRAEPTHLAYLERPVAQAPASVPSTPLIPWQPQSAPFAPPSQAPAAVVLVPSASAERGGSASLAEQQALLDIARSDFARSDYAATLQALSAHFRRYPKSVLGEEREALEIKALAASGRDTEAKARAARFVTQFPQSLLLPSVHDSVSAIP